MKDLKKIDWRVLQRYTSPQAVKDFDAFLDALPVNVGYNALIAAGMAWVIAGAAVFFTSMEVDRVSTLRAEMMKIEALQPPIPQLEYVPVPQEAITVIGDKIMSTYPGVKVAGSPGKANVTASDTDYFAQFMAAISTLQNGGKSWKVSIGTLCVGRECTSGQLSADLKIEIAKIGEPKAAEEDGEQGTPPGADGAE